MSPEEFDKEYLAWLDKQLWDRRPRTSMSGAKQLKALVGGWRSRNSTMRCSRKATAVSRMYPEYVEDANAYEFLAEAHLAKGDKKAAAAVLTAYEKIGGEDPATLKKLASLEEELGHRKKRRRRWTASTTSIRSTMRTCIAIWATVARAGELSGAMREYTRGAGAEAAGQGVGAVRSGAGVLCSGTERQGRGKRAGGAGSRAGISSGAEVAVGD